jgi:PIN domain nuclease of toxin-antitoxin system
MSIDNPSPAPLLIDTHYWIWLQLGIRERLNAKNLDVIQDAADRGNLFVSVISIREVGLLRSKAASCPACFMAIRQIQ